MIKLVKKLMLCSALIYTCSIACNATDTVTSSDNITSTITSEAYTEEDTTETTTVEETTEVSTYVRYCGAESLNIRKGSSVDYDSIGYISYADQIVVQNIDHSDDWVECIYNNEVAYCNRNYLTINEPDPIEEVYSPYNNMEYAGTYQLTAYGYSSSKCANGRYPTAGYTVAAPKNFALGTRLYIEGYGEYVVEDRGGFGNNVIDIYYNRSEEWCNANFGRKYGVAVYVIK